MAKCIVSFQTRLAERDGAKAQFNSTEHGGMNTYSKMPTPQEVAEQLLQQIGLLMVKAFNEKSNWFLFLTSLYMHHL